MSPILTMHEELSAIWHPSPAQIFKAVQNPPVARWVEHRRRTYHVAEASGDYQRHPWVGERQAGKADNLYARLARGVDRELLALPYEQRLQQPRNGLWPIVRGGELGEGPNPWDRRSNAVFGPQFERYGSGPHNHFGSHILVNDNDDGGGGGGSQYMDVDGSEIYPPTNTSRARSEAASHGTQSTRNQRYRNAPANLGTLYTDTQYRPQGPAAQGEQAMPLPRQEGGRQEAHGGITPDTLFSSEPAPRTAIARVKNVLGHTLSRTAEAAGAVAGAAGGAVLGAQITESTAGKINVTDQAMDFGAKAGRNIVRRLTPKTGKRAGNGKSFINAAKTAVNVAQFVRAEAKAQAKRRTATRPPRVPNRRAITAN